MFFVLSILFLHFLAVFIGIIFHILFTFIVIKRLDNYSRVNVSLISISMTMVLLSFLAKQIHRFSDRTILSDTYKEDETFMMFHQPIFRYGLMLRLTSQLAFSFDRFISATCAKLHSSKLYLAIFIAFLLINQSICVAYTYFLTFDPSMVPKTFWMVFVNSFIVANIPFICFTRYLAKKRYQATLGESLNTRFELSELYKLSRSFMTASIFDTFLSVIIIGSFWLNTWKTFQVDALYFSFYTDLLFNIEMAIYPLIVVLNHKLWCRNIPKLLLFWRRNNSIQPVNVPTDLNGKTLTKTVTQKDYFHHLAQQWDEAYDDNEKKNAAAEEEKSTEADTTSASNCN